MKFGVFTDLHYDVIPDGDRRIQELIRTFKDKNVDFVIELGDLCNPIPENRKIPDAFKNADIPCYFSLGNHNTDFCPPETALQFLGLKKGYYSIVRENVKFIFLDANYVKTKSGFLPECKQNVQDETSQFPYIPTEQMEWLQNELYGGNGFYAYVICSHQSLANGCVSGTRPRGIVNRREIRAILERKNLQDNNILLCMNGHDHGNCVKIINGICYYSLNSASYIWQNVKETYYYTKEIHQKYPYLKNLILYREPLHVIVSIDEAGTVKIEGMKGSYLNVAPEDIGMGDSWNGVSIKPETDSICIARQRNPSRRTG